MKRSTLLGLVLAMLCGLSGCHTMGPLNSVSLPWSSSQKVIESKYRSPVRMVAIWSDASYNSLGKKPVRGFGGRIYFYDEKQQPVAIEGQLVVYAYDDTNPRGPAEGPSRKYVFTPDQLTEHFSETDLGASYSVWLPWDEIGGEQKNISLLPILTASSGQVVTGSPSLTLLPGAKPAGPPDEYFSRVEPESAGARPSLSKLQSTANRHPAHREGAEVATVGYNREIVATEGPQAPTQMVTTTIKPTGRLAEQLLVQRSQRIAEQYRQRNQLPSPGPLPPASAGSEPGGEATRFSRRPGESYPSRIYTGQPTNARALLPASESVPESAR
jgi:hypothetical protein